MCGWIKLHRKLTEWEWYSDVNTSRVFIHLLLSANHKDAKWRGINIKRGQKLTSLSKLAVETNLSIKNIRTSIKRLKATNEVASLSNAQHTVFTIINYDLYQGDGKLDGEQVASEGQANGKQVATNKNDNKEKNDNNEDKLLDAFNYFWLNMKLKKSAKPKAITSFDKHAKKESDPMAFAEMLVSDTKQRSELNQFGFDNLNPTTYLNQKRWEDDKPIDIAVEYKYVLDDFNEAMQNTQTPRAESMTVKRVRAIKHLFATTSLTPETVKNYFSHLAIAEAFAWERGETGSQPVDLSYYLTEQAYNKAKEQ